MAKEIEMKKGTIKVKEAVDREEIQPKKRSYPSKYDPLVKKILNLEPGQVLPIEVDIENADRMKNVRINISSLIRRRIKKKGLSNGRRFTVRQIDGEEDLAVFCEEKKEKTKDDN